MIVPDGAFAQQRLHSLYGTVQIPLDVVPPKAYHAPTLSAQASEITSIATAIPLDFSSPIISQLVLPRRKSPSMPKITVYENRQLSSRKDEIGFARERFHVSPASQPPPAKRRCNNLFKRRVPPFYSLHRFAALFRR